MYLFIGSSLLPVISMYIWCGSKVQYRSFITSLLHACTRMVPRSILRVKILGLPWKKFFPRDESWHLAWHFTTRVISTRRGFPRIYTQRA